MQAVHFWGQERGSPVGRKCPTCDWKREYAKGKKRASALRWNMDTQTIIQIALNKWTGLRIQLFIRGLSNKKARAYNLVWIQDHDDWAHFYHLNTGQVCNSDPYYTWIQCLPGFPIIFYLTLKFNISYTYFTFVKHPIVTLQLHSQEPSDLHHSILTYGIILNSAKAEEGSGLPEAMLPGLMTTIAQVLDQDQRKLVTFQLIAR